MNIQDLIEPKSNESKIYETYEDFDFDKLCLYAGMDNIATSTVLSKLMPDLVEPLSHRIEDHLGVRRGINAPSILSVNDNVTKIALEYVLDMEMNGLKYDINRNREISALMQTEIDDLESKIFTHIGKKINLDSGKEVITYLYDELKLTPPSYTKSGAPSTDGEALLTLAGLDPINPPRDYITPDPSKQFLAWMAKRKDLNSVHNTFIKTYITDFVKRTGRIHPSYNLHGTSSFRITGDNPNLTQLPRPKHGYNVRECYTVDDGYVMIAFDFSSAEVKILGALCKDKNMLKAIKEGLDFHSFSASSMIGVPYEVFVDEISDKSKPKYKEYKSLRQTAKILTFSIIYGSSVAGIAMQLNISVEEAQRLVNLYFEAYPGIKKFIESSHYEALTNRKIITPFGQRRWEYGANPVFKGTAAYNAALRNSQNVRVQSPTSTLGLIVFAHLNKALKKLDSRCKAICTVYDSAEFEIPIPIAAEAAEICFYYMNDWPEQNFPWLGLQIGVEGEIGFNWGQLEVIHRGVTQEEILDILRKMNPLRV